MQIIKGKKDNRLKMLLWLIIQLIGTDASWKNVRKTRIHERYNKWTSNKHLEIQRNPRGKKYNSTIN